MGKSSHKEVKSFLPGHPESQAGSLQDLGLSKYAAVGVQNKRPHGVPQPYADYSELKATGATGSRELAALL